MSEVVMQCNNLTTKIGKKTIINNISFDINKSDILGLIGPNGAGKTTIIKSILGLYNTKKNTIYINQYDLNTNFKNAIKNVGAIIENPDMYSYLTGYENLKILKKIYKINNNRLNEVIETVGLTNKIHEKVSKYSLGMKQRLGIAQAIIHNPKLLILDEPTNGLDPEGIKELKQLLINLSKQGMAIIISSHILSELDSLCNKICIINNGKILSYTSMEELKKIYTKNNYIIEVDNINLKNYLLNYKVIDNNHIKINTNKNNINNIIKTLLLNNINIYEIKRDNISLEDIFINKIKND